MAKTLNASAVDRLFINGISADRAGVASQSARLVLTTGRGVDVDERARERERL